MDGFKQVSGLASPIEAGHQHVNPNGKAHKQIDDEHIQRAGGTHGRQRLAARKAAHHHNVGGVEQKLQNPGQGQGNGKLHQLAQKRPLGHVDFIGTAPGPWLKMKLHRKRLLSPY